MKIITERHCIKCDNTKKLTKKCFISCRVFYCGKCNPYNTTSKPAKTKNKLTINFKHSVASDILAAIKGGDNTFGKLRKALHYTDRELKSGLRYGLNNWIYKSKISKDKKTYSVVAL